MAQKEPNPILRLRAKAEKRIKNLEKKRERLNLELLESLGPVETEMEEQKLLLKKLPKS